MYDDGRGVAQDHVEAVKWHRLAAAQGNALGQSNLGRAYATGQGVTQDDVEAVKWFRLAAVQEHTLGQFNLGTMYYNGRGVPQDYARAYLWLNLAGRAGDALGLKLREEVAAKMTRRQIAEAERLTSECQQGNFKNCE
jgi:TPR repeat protein